MGGAEDEVPFERRRAAEAGVGPVNAVVEKGGGEPAFEGVDEQGGPVITDERLERASEALEDPDQRRLADGPEPVLNAQPAGSVSPRL